MTADPLPPLPPADVSAAAEEEAVNITWTAPPGDVVGYTVYRNGEALGATGQTWFLDTSPTPVAVYTVTATDSEGDESAPGGPAATSTGPGCIGFTGPPTFLTLSPQGCQEAVMGTIDELLGLVEDQTNFPAGLDGLADALASAFCATEDDGSGTIITIGPECTDLILALAGWAAEESVEATQELVDRTLEADTL